jgi:ATP/maltotriose-dependent transcriptional regulator MalT/DNA-binding SARP family transcriptional activator
MTRSFRFSPPEPRDDLMVRPRLLRSLAERWRHRVTSLTGGPGLGKTTLLAQAIAENRLAPRGQDRWVGLAAQDADADSLSRAVAAAVVHPVGDDGGVGTVGGSPPRLEPAAVADAVWGRAPNEECLVFDDVHVLTPGSSGAAWLEVLVASLPANGHVVLASRSAPALRLGRYGTQGEVLWLAEDDLRFDDDELAGFARQRGVEHGWLDVTGGWPAMAELVAVATASTGDRRLTGTYLWEEVLEPLGTVGRHVLAVLCDLGGADDALLSAAIGTRVELAGVLQGVPLVARSADGWHVAHGLWQEAPGLGLDLAERNVVRRRAVDHMLTRGLFDDAFGLAEEADLWDLVPRVLRAACLQADHLSATQLARWLSRTPEQVRDTMAGHLADGVHAWFVHPATAVEPLRRAAREARDAADGEAEVVAIARLAIDTWWRQDMAALAELTSRVNELEATGNARARGLATLGRAVVADLVGDDQQVLDLLGGIEPHEVDPAWEAACIWLNGSVLTDRGDVEAVEELVSRFRRTSDPALRYVLDMLDLMLAWLRGDVEGALARAPDTIAGARRHGVDAYLHVGLILAALGYAQAGDAETARQLMVDVRATAPPSSDGVASAAVQLAEASLLMVEGRPDEEVAQAARTAVERYGLDQGMDRRVWRLTLAATYVLLPDSRAHWDRQPLRGAQRLARDLAAAVVDVREGRLDARLHTLDVPSPGMVRAALGFRLSAELAVGLVEVGRPEGPALLAAAGSAARSVVRELAGGRAPWSDRPVPKRRARAARNLLAAVPAPPPRRTHLGVLGPVVLRRGGLDGEEVIDPDLRRRRVQELLAFLVGHRRTTRGVIAAALWPDLDERAAGNNLGVTLNHLLRVLEPWRDAGEPSYLLRLEGSSVQLVTDEHLVLDVDLFDEHLTAAARSEADGTPSLALEHDLAAVALYRDTLHLDVGDADWLALEREHYQTRFVVAAVRVGQLLLARGEIDKAQAVVYRALTTYPWSEEAYAVLVGAALARRDRAAASRVLDRCREALADLGVQPSDAFQQLRRRVELA